MKSVEVESFGQVLGYQAAKKDHEQYGKFFDRYHPDSAECLGYQKYIKHIEGERECQI